MSESKITRVQLTKSTGSIISPSRVKTFLNDWGLNDKVEESSEPIRKEILKVRKEGGPRLPQAPEQLKRSATELEKSKHRDVRKKYDADLVEYNKFTSDRYRKAEVMYKLCKKLLLVKTILEAEKRTKTQEHELDELLLVLSDHMRSKKPNESDEEYQTKKAKFHSFGFKHLLESTNLKSKDSIGEFIEKHESNEDVKLFFELNDKTRKRVKFNEQVSFSIVAIMELALDELFQFGIEKTLKENKKTLQPDFCVVEGVEKLHWYSFIRTLPHFRRILDRQLRKKQYLEERKQAEHKHSLASRALAKKAKETSSDSKKVKTPKFTWISFNDQETERNFAKKTTEAKLDEEKKPVLKDGQPVMESYYEWYGIDIPLETDKQHDVGFGIYISYLCANIVSNRLELGDTEWNKVKFSANIRKFGSDLIIDFIGSLTPKIRILGELMNVKIVKKEMVDALLKIQLLDSYQTNNGYYELSETHKLLFSSIDKKVKSHNHHKGVDDTASQVEEPAKTGHKKDPTEVVIKAEVEVDELDEEIDKELEEKPKVVEKPKVKENGSSKKIKA
jgi:hypothetical protein